MGVIFVIEQGALDEVLGIYDGDELRWRVPRGYPTPKKAIYVCDNVVCGNEADGRWDPERESWMPPISWPRPWTIDDFEVVGCCGECRDHAVGSKQEKTPSSATSDRIKIRSETRRLRLPLPPEDGAA